MAVFSRRAVLQWDGDVPGGSGEVAAGSGAFTVGAIFPSIAGDPAGKTTTEELLAASHADLLRHRSAIADCTARRPCPASQRDCDGGRGEGTAGDPTPILSSHWDRRRPGRHRRIAAATTRAGHGRAVHDLCRDSRGGRGVIRGSRAALRLSSGAVQPVEDDLADETEREMAPQPTGMRLPRERGPLREIRGDTSIHTTRTIFLASHAWDHLRRRHSHRLIASLWHTCPAQCPGSRPLERGDSAGIRCCHPRLVVDRSSTSNCS